MSDQSVAVSLDELLGRAQEGDKAALSEFIIRTRPGVFHCVLRIVQSHAAAEDVTQTAYSLLVRALPKYKRDGNARAWMYKIAVNAAWGYLRTEGRLNELCGEMKKRGIADSGEDPAATLQRREELERLTRALQALPEDYRTALVLKYLKELPAEEVARVLGQTVSEVYGLLHRARTALREALGSDAADEEDVVRRPKPPERRGRPSRAKVLRAQIGAVKEALAVLQTGVGHAARLADDVLLAMEEMADGVEAGKATGSFEAASRFDAIMECVTRLVREVGDTRGDNGAAALQEFRKAVTLFARQLPLAVKRAACGRLAEFLNGVDTGAAGLAVSDGAAWLRQAAPGEDDKAACADFARKLEGYRGEVPDGPPRTALAVLVRWLQAEPARGLLTEPWLGTLGPLWEGDYQRCLASLETPCGGPRGSAR